LPGLGPLGLDAHALSKAGEPKDIAVRRLRARQTLGLAAHLLLLLVALALASVGTRPAVALPSAWPALAGAAAVLALVGLARGAGRYRRLVVGPSLAAVREALSAGPSRVAASAAAAVGLTAVNVAAFVLALSLASVAEGGLPSTASLARLALVYLLAAVVAAASPTPAGVAAFEPFATLGLLLCGVDVVPAVAGVLLFRVATLWAPVAVGAIPFVRLRRRGVI
jgi:undecaprenyl-diphosphatase